LSRKLSAVVLTLVLAGWLLPGCGSNGGKMTTATASTLQRDVDAVVSATDASRWDAAIEALDQLEADVASAQGAGTLGDERAAQIRAVRQRMLDDLQLIRLSGPTPSPAATTQTTPSTETDNNGGGNDSHGRKSEDDDQAEDGGGKSEDDDQGEDSGGKHKDDDQGEDGDASHKGKNKS
jgi:hypothetical protein